MKRVLAILLTLVMLMVAASAAAEPIQLEYWSVFTGADGATMQAMVDAFNQSQDEVFVNHTPMPADEMYQKIPLSVQSGTGVPDVCIVHVERIPYFASTDMLYSYDMDLLAQAGIKAENYNSTLWSRSDIDGEHYGIPLDIFSATVFYNKDLFDKYDLNSFVEDNVLTFDEIRAMGDKARAGGWEGAITNLGDCRHMMLSFYAQLDSNMTLSSDGITPCVNNENMKKVYETMKSLFEDGYTTKKDDDAAAMFYGGEMLAWSAGIWMTAAVREAGINFGLIPEICYDASNIKNWSSGHNFVQFADEARTEEEDLAVAKFVNFMGENSETWATNAGMCPAHTSINQVANYQEMPQSWITDPANNSMLAVYSYKYWGLFETAFTRIGWDITDGSIGIDEALAQIDAEINDAIAAQ